MRLATIALALALALPGLPGPHAIGIGVNRAVTDFPNTVRFELSATSQRTITAVELEFGTDALACGERVTRIVPEGFAPGAAVEAAWTWQLRRTGPLPPGTTVWWSWRVREAGGAELVTPRQEVVFEDPSQAWRTLRAGPLTLHWASGSEADARTLLERGERALGDLRELTGVELDSGARIYIYPSSQAMQAATLFAPDWSGGLAFPAHRAVLIGIPPGSLEWGQRALAHELAHVVIGQFTFSCVDSTPIWVDEGLAMTAEGEPEPYYRSLLERAARDDTLLPVRSLSSTFSGDSNLAALAYAQSHSLVTYLIERGGAEDMLALLEAFRRGAPEDRALLEVYGFDREGLEAEWRRWIGAPAARATPAGAATPTRTPYPTFAPITGPEAAATATPRAAQPAAPPGGLDRPRLPLLLAVALGLGGCAATVGIVAVAVWVIAARRPRRAPGANAGRRPTEEVE